MSPFPSSISQIWLTIGSSFLHSGGHKDKGTSAFVILYLVPIGVNAEGAAELGKLERNSKELVVVECPVQRCLLGLAVGSLVVECPVVGVSLAVVGL